MNSTTAIQSANEGNFANIILASTICLALELFLAHPMSLLASIFNFLLIFNTKLLHNNLKLILLAQSFTIALFSMSRMTFVAARFIQGDLFFVIPIFSTLGMSISLFRNNLIHALLLERTVATILFRSYGQFNSNFPFLAIFSVIISGILAFFQSFLQNGNSQTPDIYSIILYGLYVLLTLSESIIIFMLYAFNWKFYRFHALPLDQRFQLSENIRTAKQLMPAYFFHFANICLNISTQYFIFFHVTESIQLVTLYFTCTILANGFLNFLIELTVITHHPLLKRRAMNWLRMLFRLRSINAIEDIGHRQRQQMANLNGQTLISVSELESHFKMLNKMWK